MRVWILAALLATAATPALAAGDIPPALNYQGEPLDPMCFQSWQDDMSVALADCTKSSDIIAEEHALRAEDGWIDYTYRFADMPKESAIRGWVAWRYLGETNAGHVVETYHHGGGSGQFTAVETVRREGDRLHLVETHMGGDRCNGGVAAAAVSDGVLAGAVNITPYDLLAVALGEEGVPFAAYDDIDSCAICCIGTATVVGDDLGWVRLEPLSRGDDGPQEPETPQACLDRLIDESRQTLTRPELDRFGKAFLERCGP